MAKDEKIKGKFALFCDYALTSSDGKLSILGEFDQINSTSDNPHLHKGYLVASFDGEPQSNAEIDVKLSDPKDENILFKGTFNIKFSPGGRANIMIEFGNLPFKKFGVYEADFLSLGKSIIKTHIKIVKVTQTPPIQA